MAGHCLSSTFHVFRILSFNKIKKQSGGLLLIDYGFLEQKSKNTLQSIKNHKSNMIFENVGNADITSLVNFNLIKSSINLESS